jgi:hypothetical protein
LKLENLIKNNGLICAVHHGLAIEFIYLIGQAVSASSGKRRQ